MNTLFEKFSPWASLAGRVLIALIFITAGWSKIGGYEGTQAYMDAMGVPGSLLPLVILTELGGGILVLLGLFTRYSAFALAGFTILSGILFHGDSADQMQQILFMKNLAIAGGFLFLVANGAGRISLDHRFGWK
jgi:putative oxidoreductase